MVSDSENDTLETQEAVDVDDELAMIDFWPVLMESVHLQVASRTTRTWGKQKVYEVYRLAGPTVPVSNVEQVRGRIAREFLTLSAGAFKTEGRRSYRHHEDCRVFIAQHRDSNTLWVQINLGQPYDCRNEMNRSVTGEKKKKDETEYVAMLTPESNLIALTASRAPSRSRFTPYILAALESVLTCSVAGGYASGGKDRWIRWQDKSIFVVDTNAILLYVMNRYHRQACSRSIWYRAS